MKFVIISFLFISIPYLSICQNWSGSTPGDIYYTLGSVGIGTTTPAGITTSSYGLVVKDKRIGIRSLATNSILDLGESNANRGIFQWFNEGGYLNISSRINSVSYGELTLRSGKVGIGTTSPSASLDVRIDDTHGNIANFLSNVGVSTPEELKWSIKIGRAYDFPNRTLEFGMVSGSYGQNPAFFVAPKGDEVFRITEIGNVGIGTTDISEKLVVDGTILAEEVKVQNVPQSDYVFEPEYNLLSLTEVEAFIKENKHLPEIPSAEEFKENGVGLGEMDDMLLRKVEELTLYIIQQNKELEELQMENEQLQTENSNKEAKIESLEEKVDRILEMLEASK